MEDYSLLKQLWERWKKFARWAGDLQGRIILTVLYFTVVAPFGLGTRFFSDPLVMKHQSVTSFWHPRRISDVSIAEARNQ